MLKFHLKKERLHFTRYWKTSEKEMERDELASDLLNQLLKSDFQDILDTAIRTMDDGSSDDE